jgi:hypothetical protein
MSRFNIEHKLQVGNTALTVKVQKPEDAPLVERAREVLEQSKTFLKKTQLALASQAKSQEVLKVGRICFWPNELKDKDLATIKAIIDRIDTGLNSDKLQIKTSDENIVRPKSHETAMSAHGATSKFQSFEETTYDSWRRDKYPEGDVKKEQIEALPMKDHHHRHMCLSTKQWFVVGTIRIQGQSLLLDGLGPVTLLHEASHRYAGTSDGWNLPDDAGTKPLPLADLKTKIEQKVPNEDVNKAKALQNADSYAWFIYMLGTD